ncbi:hypothetical protein N431DRAFT_445356 [Stipitochalara longipes BDJ]|nr:hypothetical protein N431DRAFT_445356 [Stipitochalara longipes BDJ]
MLFGGRKRELICALRYVWGSYPAIKLKIDNVEQFQQPGFLGALQLPQAITDASELASMLDTDYLWADTLCIIQDDDEDKKYQIGKMGSIYNSTFLTIVAASGDDSGAGLPGLWPNTRFYKQEDIVVIPHGETDGGLSLMTTVIYKQQIEANFVIDAIEVLIKASEITMPGQCKSACFPDATSSSQGSKYYGLPASLILRRISI